MRKALRPIDETIGIFDRIAEHPEMGMVHYSHLTLTDLAAHFPEQYRKVTDYRSVAIVRDPIDRFYSAVFQRLREFKGYEQSRITAKVVEQEAESIAQMLLENTDRLALEYVHFNRQVDYIFNRDERIVEHVFALDRLGDASAYIEACTGVRVATDVAENRTVALRAGVLAPAFRALRGPYGALVPYDIRNGIRTRLTRLGVYGNVEKRRYVKSGSGIERFLAQYYRRDFDLFTSTRAQ